ncbi:MAG: 50S ribosomal protein L30 [Rickettsiaceae bacterium]
MSKSTTTKNSKRPRLRVTQIRSSIGRMPDQRATLIGLGLNKLHKSVILNSDAAIDGMINKVKHLLKVEIID